MLNHHVLKCFFFLVFNVFGFLVSAQLSKTHYIPPLTSAEFGNANPEEQYIYISTPSAANINYTIMPVGQPVANYITGVVSNANPQEIFLGTGNGQLFIPSPQTSRVVNDRGYIIEAEGTIYVSVRMNAGGGAQAGALVSKGLAALGTTFRVGSYTNESPQDNYLNFVSVMATEDNTQVTFSDLPAGLIIKNYFGTTPVVATLNKGESYTIATNSNDGAIINRDGLIGTLVSSDKPIVVNCGSANGSFGGGGGRDYGLDQIVGLSKVGTEYIFVRGDGSDAWENVLIVAHTNNTTVSVNGNGPIATINAGEFYVIEGNFYSSIGNMYVETSQPVFAYQGVGGLGNTGNPAEANQGMFFVPPLSCETRGNLDNIAKIQSIGTRIFSGGVSIVTKVGATVTINNSPLSNFSTIGPSNVTGKTDYITYKILGLSGNVSVQSSDELYCAYFNYDGSATSGSFYSGFPSPPEINFDAIFTTLGVCIPNVTLEVANTGSFDSFEWFFDDGAGGGFVTTGNTSLQYTPTQSGTYKLVGTLDCTNTTLESLEVPVSICPDDIDNDGVPDNIDIDNDNDGILNCTESNGNQDIDLSNPASGTIPVGTYTYSGTINTFGSTAVTPFIGTSDGTFMSETPSRNNTSEVSVTYDLIFNKNLHLLFQYATSTALGNGLLTNDEEFIIRVPNTKTITLLDPDDQLLVDTNFDGIYETGITQISAFEIRFKPKATSLAIGAGTFSFSANSVDSFTYIHKNNSDTNTNQATFKLTATCVAKDTDLDGIEDALDLDSDNDGIPDFIENSGTLVALSGIDTDFNGLDDIYSITTTPIDSDGDGIPDFYDLDSDNDGIYDVFESGSGLLDNDFDGVIDNVLANIGVNGWDDRAETSPDSNMIGYTVNDLDADSIFSYRDLDSDGDMCSDVIEAGFSDANGDDILGDSIATTDASGLVNNAVDGYTLPNSDYLTAAPITITTQPADTEVCELSDTTISVVSTTVDSVQWEVSSDGINWTSIVDDATYNGSQTTDLNILATPLTFNSYQYRAFLNVAGNSCGLYTDEAELTVITLPIANIAPVMRQCDDDNNGTMPFDLTSQNNAINTTPGMTITYHASQADADTGNAPLASPYESGNTTIHARVVNDLNTNCYDTSSFDLEVYESPVPLNAPNITSIQECDNTSVGSDTDGFILFDLTQRETEILNGQSPTDFTLTYFTDSAYANQITNSTTYPNATANNQTIYVRMTNNFYNTCFSDTAFEIEVYELPQVSNPNVYQQCDDASNDRTAYFNLTLDWIKEDINSNYIPEGLTFTYYENQTQAETIGGVEITDATNYFVDLTSATFITVWIRATNLNGCYRTVPLNLEISPSSAALSAYAPNSIYQCDDGSDLRDGVATFDLTNIRDYITTTIFSTFNVTVHFYESQLDAELETNEILDPANHQNINSPNSQDIWVRVKSDLGNNCLGLEEFPDLLIVEALPVANPVSMARQCDYDTTDSVLSYPFDTSQLENNILNGQNPADVSITYFDANGAPLLYSDGSQVTSPIQPIFLTGNQTITIRVTNNSTLDPDGACYDETTLEFIVDQQPIANSVPAFIVCDGAAGDADDDGLYAFNTTTVQSIILDDQIGMDVYYTYIDELGNVLTSQTLPNPFNSGNQTVFVEVINPINLTCSATTSIDFIVNPLPDFNIETPQIVCSSDPTFTIVLDPIEANQVENFNYSWVLNGNEISTNPTLTVSEPGTYTITLSKADGTGCSRSKNVFVNASELATITQEDVTINDITDNNTVTINNPTSLGLGNYWFSLESIDGQILYPYQDEPIFTNVKAGFYNLFVEDKDDCGTASLTISVIGYPKFFTPNNDGYNDFWQIQGINALVQPNSSIHIFDRYGKLLKQLSPASPGWDGTFNGSMLSSDDYWFKVLLQDGRTFTGHFTLKR